MPSHVQAYEIVILVVAASLIIFMVATELLFIRSGKTRNWSRPFNPVEGMRVTLQGGVQAAPTSKWMARLKIAALTILVALLALFLAGCEGEGGAYCAGGPSTGKMTGHPLPWLKSLMKIHDGAVGDLAFFLVVASLATLLASFQAVRSRLQMQRYDLWHCFRRLCPAGRWIILLLLCTLLAFGGLCNRVRRSSPGR
jgi:hypothetical protein